MSESSDTNPTAHPCICGAETGELTLMGALLVARPAATACIDTGVAALLAEQRATPAEAIIGLAHALAGVFGEMPEPTERLTATFRLAWHLLHTTHRTAGRS